MSLAIILDADFLSAFLKIDRLELVRYFYGVETLQVPLGVYQEVSQTNLVAMLAGLGWIQVETPITPPDDPGPGSDFLTLGRGEREAILLSLRHRESRLLMNDLKAQRIARDLGVETVDVAAFLLSCKSSGFANQEQIRELVEALQEKDYYGFRKEVLAQLLS